MKPFGKLSFAEVIVLIEMRLKAAMRLLKRCRHERHDIPDKIHSAWPDILRGWLGQQDGDPGYEKDGIQIPKDSELDRDKRLQPKPAPPSPDELDRMDQALQWLLWVPNGSRALVMAKAAGASWGALAVELKMSVIDVRTRHKLGLEAILERLMEES